MSVSVAKRSRVEHSLPKKLSSSSCSAAAAPPAYIELPKGGCCTAAGAAPRIAAWPAGRRACPAGVVAGRLSLEPNWHWEAFPGAGAWVASVMRAVKSSPSSTFLLRLLLPLGSMSSNSTSAAKPATLPESAEVVVSTSTCRKTRIRPRPGKVPAGKVLGPARGFSSTSVAALLPLPSRPLATLPVRTRAYACRRWAVGLPGPRPNAACTISWGSRAKVRREVMPLPCS